MSELSWVALLLGLTALTAGAVAWRSPARVRAGLTAFPRSIWPGRVLAAIDMIWAAYALSQMHLGMFDTWKVHLFWLTPVGIVLCIVYLDELLSPRALGGLLLLAAGPVLNIARWHPSDWRLVIAALAYLWIGAGLLFLLSPWWFRRIALFTAKNDAAIHIGGAVKVISGIGLILLAFFVY